MEWCTDFCLSCDQQTNGSAYCSQMCRLADLDRVTASSSFEPLSPLSTPSSSGSPTSASFTLAPAIDFSAYRTTPVTFSQPHLQLKPAPTRMSLQRAMTLPITSSSSANNQLKMSPSGTSLSSMQSTQSNRSSLSQQSKNDLFAYANSFDQIRDLKRRKSLY